MAQRAYKSPWTGNVWPDIRPAVGTIIGLANYLNNQRPRRRPPEGADDAVRAATKVVAAFAGLPQITPHGVVGAQLSDVYWDAQAARALLKPFVDDGVFLYHHGYWTNDNGTPYFEQLKAAAVLASGEPPRPAWRLAWWAARLAEKAACSSQRAELTSYSTAVDIVRGAASEIAEAGVQLPQAAAVENNWRFIAAAGRYPESPQDDDLVAAFEAALMADDPQFALDIVRQGWGGRIDESES